MKLTRVYNRGQKNDRNFVFKVLTKDNSQCRITYMNKEIAIKGEIKVLKTVIFHRKNYQRQILKNKKINFSGRSRVQ